jgi:hypothetical protein
MRQPGRTRQQIRGLAAGTALALAGGMTLIADGTQWTDFEDEPTEPEFCGELVEAPDDLAELIEALETWRC